MRDWDLTAIFHFLTIPKMYLGNDENDIEQKVDIFLSAYEAGAKLECGFRGLLLEHLMAKYNISSHPGGFVNITKSAAALKNTDSLELIVTEGKEVLCKVSDSDGANRFADILRKDIADFVKKGPDPQCYSWGIYYWYQIVKFVEKWPGVNLNPNEMELIQKVTETWEKCLYPRVNEFPETLKNDMVLLKELVERNLSFS